MKSILLLCLLMPVLNLEAQQGIRAMVDAEKAFAALSVAEGTRTAFLQYLDSNGVVFEKGKAVNGRESWLQKKSGNGQLNWHPMLAEVSASGEFGYTTGPWWFRSKPGDSIVASGQFTTVWHYTEGQGWKFLADLGNSSIPLTDTLGLQLLPTSTQKNPASLLSLEAIENHFIALFSNNRMAAYATLLSSRAVLNRNGHHPATGRKAVRAAIKATPALQEWTILGRGISASGDLGYVYGSVKTGTQTENFLHIWRQEKKGWKLALEVLRYPS